MQRVISVSMPSTTSLGGLCLAETLWAHLPMEHSTGTPQVLSGRGCFISRIPTPMFGCHWAKVLHALCWQVCMTVGLSAFFSSLLDHVVLNWIWIVAFLLKTVPLLWYACFYNLSSQFKCCQGAMLTLASWRVKFLSVVENCLCPSPWRPALVCTMYQIGAVVSVCFLNRVSWH